MQERVLLAWQALINSNQSSLVITHGGPIRILCCHMAEHPIQQLFEIDVAYADMRRFSLPTT